MGRKEGIGDILFTIPILTLTLFGKFDQFQRTAVHDNTVHLLLPSRHEKCARNDHRQESIATADHSSINLPARLGGQSERHCDKIYAGRPGHPTKRFNPGISGGVRPITVRDLRCGGRRERQSPSGKQTTNAAVMVQRSLTANCAVAMNNGPPGGPMRINAPGEETAD